MTRRGMFFKLLGALGLGQHCLKPEGCSVPPGWGEMPNANKCVALRDGLYWNAPCSPSDVECKEGEERCPLGHCQKPHNQTAIFGDIEEILGHVCSTCGIVYVPKPPAKEHEK